MNKAIVNGNVKEGQLIYYGMDLVHKIRALYDCVPELSNNKHMIKAKECANTWNELFFEWHKQVVSTTEGVK